MFFRIPGINPLSECIHRYNKLALKKQIQQVQCCFTEKQTKQQAQLAVKWHICPLGRERTQNTNQTTCLHKIAWYPVRHQRQLGNNHQDGLPKTAMLLLLPDQQDKSTADYFYAVLNSSASILSASIFCYSGSVSTGHLYHLRIHRWCSYCRCPVPEYLYMSFRT